ncbi:LysR family transcriptional regulator (plasmid) [Streptomyces sp. JL4002]|uniref:LysR family transcriptional regulator n=1 Tax=Streptomyces sp. JL4002 TaxID=3404781 RepID=UPI003B283EEA
MLGMDLVGACRAFVSVTERGSFTTGAAAARMSQPVASRRIAALEELFGEPLFERTSRRATLSSFGQDMLPAARRLVQAADALLHEAETAKRKPWRLAVPDNCSTGSLARLIADARDQAVILDLQTGTPAHRVELLRSQQVRAALIAAPADEATWSVPLGLAGTAAAGARRVYLATLRIGRAGQDPARKVWIQPEDDVPHIRDPLTRLRNALGLRPVQLAIAPDLANAIADVLRTSDLLLCSAAQADELGLDWRPLGEIALSRGYSLAAAPDVNLQRVQERLGSALMRCFSPATGIATPDGGTAV